MARPSDAGATLALCLEEARAGTPAPAYLFEGDAYLAGRAARALAEALVPEAARALNLVELDAACSPSEVAAELATAGLFGGSKVVVVAEPAFLSSREDQGEAFARAREMWQQGRQREAARRLLALAAKAGWSAAELDPGAEGTPGAEDWRRELGVELGEGGAGFVAAAARWAVERELRAGQEDASALDALLARGLPPGRALVVAAGKVDGRLPLVRRLAAVGRRVGFRVEREGRWGEDRPVLGPVLEALLAGTGKAADRGAEARLAALVGDDARTLAAEVAKLVAFAGDRKVIRAADVDEVVARSAADAFFALGNAVEKRDLEGALAVLDRGLAAGSSIHALVGALASTVRRLIVEGERARRAVGARPIASFDDWQAAVLPLVPPEELEGKKPFGFWMKYQAAARFQRAALLEALSRLAEADLGAKSGREARPLVERVLLRLLAEPERSGAA
jgi:DNA polymerase-3 subunit delta